MKKFLLSLSIAGLIFVGGKLNAAIALDWSEWKDDFVAGGNNQSLTTSEGLTITYSWSKDPATTLQFGTPDIASRAEGNWQFNGTGGEADDYLDVFQEALSGDGSTHRFEFSSSVSGLSFDLWDLDSSTTGANLYTDQVMVIGFDQDGNQIDPVSGTPFNPANIVQIDSHTWQATSGNGASSVSQEGNLTIQFDEAVAAFEIEYLNVSGETSAGNQGFGLYNFSETSQVPEPSAGLLALLGSTLLLTRRSRGR
ncbi:MAG: hypothetical protein AAF555_05485 [Verrucomicrobiota bacterium]